MAVHPKSPPVTSAVALDQNSRTPKHSWQPYSHLIQAEVAQITVVVRRLSALPEQRGRSGTRLKLLFRTIEAPRFKTLPLQHIASRHAHWSHGRPLHR